MADDLLEKNDEGVTQPTKFDGAKVKTNLYPVRAYIETCKVFHYGSIVYSEGNWKEGNGFEWGRLTNSFERHYRDFQLGVDLDHESGLPVLAHMACCSVMLLESVLTGKGTDSRARSQIIIPGEDLSKLMLMDPDTIRRAHLKRATVEALRKAADLSGGQS